MNKGRAVSGWCDLACAAVLYAALGLISPSASAETLTEALSRAYGTNPELNAERARQRATDETVAQALSGYRPSVTGTADVGVLATETELANPTTARVPGGGFAVNATQANTLYPRGVGVAVQQSLFNGFRTTNTVKQAESGVRAGREALRNVEQNVLLDAVTAYMDVLRDLAIVELRRSNVAFLTETLRATRDRFNVGEVTRTDVAQAEARLSRGQSQLDTAQAQLQTSRAAFRRVTGVEPGRLAPGQPIDRLLPRTLDAAIALGRREHPAILAANFNVDSAQYAVKAVEGELLPSVTVQGSLQRRYDPSPQAERVDTAQVVGRMNIPLYEGGEVSARVRQSKEVLGQRRLQLDQAREQVHAAIVSSWGNVEASRANIAASEAEVRAAEIALAGVREEARVGQRTTLDVLDAQQDVVDARSRLVQAQRDRVVASYSLLSAVGRLGPKPLALPVREYKPEIHYEIVRDKWFGLRTPAGE